MRLRRLLPLLVVTLVAVACAPAPNLRDETLLNDTSLISGEPCGAPCWQNLIPGETAWGVALDSINEHEEYVVLDTETNRRTGEAWIEFAFRDGLKCCRIYTNNGETLTTILLLLAPQISVSDVIAHFGEPTYITGQAETSDQAFLALAYPTTPMLVYAFAENISDSELTGDNEVIGLVYMSAAEMDNLLQTQNLYNWNGYGVLADVIDGTFDITPIPQTEDE